MQTRWHVAKDDADWLDKALAFVRQAEAQALAERGIFHIVLAGGSTPGRVYTALAAEAHDWARWQIWFGDERCLPPDDPERNSWMAQTTWLDGCNIPHENIHPIPAELGGEQAVQVYIQQLADQRVTQTGFDLVLLGLGEDAHTASLFPGHYWGDEPNAPPALAIFTAPKPPPERVSLSARQLSQTRAVLFLVTGAGKRPALAAWRKGEHLPAAAVQPACGVDVLMDQPASGEE